ncbi:MAG: hypothetical protein N3J91_01750 [Verrucomicrobiae bacterium]|nr:hypothetical protein [Verrucomicrobiae bacterium]
MALLLWMLATFTAHAGEGLAHSTNFTLDTRPYLGPFFNQPSATSGLFTVDTRSLGGGMDGPVVIYPTLAFNEETRTLSLAARIHDPLYGRITAGDFVFGVVSPVGVVVLVGSGTYEAVSGQWLASATLPAGLWPGQYAVDCLIHTDRQRRGTASAPLTVAASTATLNGTVRHRNTPTPIAGAQVALFEAGGVNGFWTLVHGEYGGHIPPLATLLSRLTPVRPVVKTGADGVYAWNDVPVGSAYVIVVSANQYQQQYANVAYISRAGAAITRHIRLWSTAATLAALSGEVTELQEAAEAVLNYNAGRMAALCKAVQDDNLLTEPEALDDATDWAGYISTLNPGREVVNLGRTLGGVSMKTAVKVVLASALERYAEGMMMDAVRSLHEKLSLDLTNKTFPVTKGDFIASAYHVGHQNLLNAKASNFLTAAATTLPRADFDFGQARRLLREQTASLQEVPRGKAVFIAYPRASDGIGVFKLETMVNQYHRLAAIEHTAAAGEAVLGAVQAVGSAVVLGCLVSKVAAPLAGISATVAKGAGYAEYAVSSARIGLKRQMALVFISSFGAYYEDNNAAVTSFGSASQFLLNEAAAPVYLKAASTFSADTTVDLKLSSAFGDEYLFSWGLPNLDVARGTARVTVRNTGNTPADYRVVGYTIWSPMTIKKLVGLDQATLLTYSSWAGTNQVPAGTSVELPLDFQGYSRNFLSQLRPHYLTVDIYSGPWRAGTQWKPFYVFGLGEVLRPKTWSASALQPPQGEVVAPAASRHGQLRMREVRAKVRNAAPLMLETLSAQNNARSVEFAAGTNLFALDLQLFAPPEAEVSLLVTDSQGRRLGFSSTHGLTHNEIAGHLTDTSRRPVSLRLQEPPPGENYLVTVAWLNPGPRPVTVGLFQEPVEYTDALLVVNPARIVVDCAGMAQPTVDLMVAEGSQQHPLTSVTATLTNLVRVGGAEQLTLLTNAVQTVADLGAGETAMVSWPIHLPPHAGRGKYTSMVKLTSAQTADLSLPVIALVRKASNIVSLLGGTQVNEGTQQSIIMLNTHGQGFTWLHVPKGYYVLHAQLGVAPGSTNLLHPAIDIGADGQTEWSFTGLFDAGVVVDNLEAAINQYLVAHPSSSNSTMVPIHVTGNPGAAVQLAGLQVYLETLPAEWRSIAVQPDGQARLELAVQPGWQYRVEASTNLISWQLLETFTATNSVMPFTDVNAAGARVKFYRAIAH